MIRATCPHCTTDRDLAIDIDPTGKVTGVCAVHDIVLEGTVSRPAVSTVTIDRRTPYIGSGADGAHRSAAIDREEADTLDRHDPRRDELLDSAHRWDLQARAEDAEAMTNSAAILDALDAKPSGVARREIRIETGAHDRLDPVLHLVDHYPAGETATVSFALTRAILTSTDGAALTYAIRHLTEARR